MLLDRRRQSLALAPIIALAAFAVCAALFDQPALGNERRGCGRRLRRAYRGLRLCRRRYRLKCGVTVTVGLVGRLLEQKAGAGEPAALSLRLG